MNIRLNFLQPNTSNKAISPPINPVVYTAKPKYLGIELVKNNSYNRTKVLTPKEMLIKVVKTKLDIDDNDYDSIYAATVLTAAIDKTDVAQVVYEKDETTDSKLLAVNIGSFSFSRTWHSE